MLRNRYKNTDKYSNTTLGGAISHLANFAPPSLGTRKDETIILALPEAIQPGLVCSSPQVCFCLGQNVFLIQRVYNWKNEGCPWSPEHICTLCVKKNEEDWQLLILQLRAVVRLVCQVQFPLQQLRVALRFSLVYVLVTHFLTPASHIQTGEGIGNANEFGIGRDLLVRLMRDVTVGSFWFPCFVIDCIECSSAQLYPMYNLNFKLRVQARCFTFNFWQKQNSAAWFISFNTHVHFILSWAEIKGGKQNTLKNSIIHPFKLFVHVIYFFLLKMFPKGSVFSLGLLQRLRVNNIPQQMPLFYSVEALPSTPPCPTSPTSTTPESYLDWPGRAAKGFVKLPPVISPARGIAAEPTHTRWCGHTLRLHAGSAFIRCIHLYFSSSWGWVSPASDERESNSPLLWLIRYSHFHRANFDEFLFSWLLFAKEMFCQPVIITQYCNVFKLNTAEKDKKLKFKWTFLLT